MRSLPAVALPLSLLALFPTVLAAPNEPIDNVLARELMRRAAPDGPSGNYAPATVDCPSEKPTIRDAATLSPSEAAWLQKRRANTIDPMLDFFKRAAISGFDAASYIQSNSQNFSVVPNIGIAMSGGGYRALMNGAGFIAAADSRTPGSTSAGGIGGLLQSSTYLAGLSGGGWLVGSIFANNFSTIPSLRDGEPGSALWQFSRSILEGPKDSGLSILNTAGYWSDIADQVDDKRDAGYGVSITDYWSRALSYQLINDRDGGPSYTFSSIADADHFKNADTPMPILVADERQPGETIISLSSTVFEMNPWEIGSFDPTVFGFAPTKYVGSNFTDGVVPDDGQCVRGFDQYGFIMGTSSSLFNQVLLQNLTSSSLPDVITDALTSILEKIGQDENDIAEWRPNPFYKYHPESNGNADTELLTLVDGGEDLQNIPLHPLVQPVRAVDVIFAVDSSADTTYNFPNGTALRATYERSLNEIGNGTKFPAVPDAETFINLGLNRRPTFFGCDTSNFTSSGGENVNIPPLIVYVPLTPYTTYSNASTFDPAYTDEERNAFIENGFNVATRGNGTLDEQWPACAACAVLSRSLERTGTAIPAACQACFDQYCWNGTTDSTPVTSFEPQPLLQLSALSAAVSIRMGGLVWAVVGAAGLALAL
ncbi:putative lysophospholipase catalytic domain-containing protein [Rosellinia necatrix]|uniref:Lysophospholipase n=1 Tax=Rosellinia necatrix TaxID=77044 RepID=A0A1W2TKD1_ROSNE|nr:putative lysophospholipase catalytic domain-containing protein [Rosellinia necatrix]